MISPEPISAHPGRSRPLKRPLVAGVAAAATGGFPDLSEFNGTVDWDALGAAYASGAVIAVAMRAGFGTVRADREFAHNQTEARARGIPAVYYWFCYPAYNSPAAEAALFNATVGPLQPGEAMAGDFEDDPNALPFPRGQAGLDWAAGFLSALQAPTDASWWYTYPSLLSDVGLQPLWQTWPFWEADYSATPDSAFAPAIARQFTNCSSVAGVSGCCDFSRVLRPPLTQWLIPGSGRAAIPSSGGGSMVQLTGADGRIHRLVVADSGQLDAQGNRGGPVHWIAVQGGTGGLDAWGGGDGELPGGGGWVVAGTLAASLWTWPAAPLPGGSTGPRELVIVEGRGQDGSIWRKAVFTDDFSVQAEWAHAAGVAPCVPGLMASTAAPDDDSAFVTHAQLRQLLTAAAAGA